MQNSHTSAVCCAEMQTPSRSVAATRPLGERAAAIQEALHGSMGVPESLRKFAAAPGSDEGSPGTYWLRASSKLRGFTSEIKTSGSCCASHLSSKCNLWSNHCGVGARGQAAAGHLTLRRYSSAVRASASKSGSPGATGRDWRMPNSLQREADASASRGDQNQHAVCC